MAIQTMTTSLRVPYASALIQFRAICQQYAPVDSYNTRD